MDFLKLRVSDSEHNAPATAPKLLFGTEVTETVSLVSPCGIESLHLNRVQLAIAAVT